MAGPLPSSRWHQDSYADAVRHGTDHRLQHRSQGSSYTASRGLDRRNGYHPSYQGNNREAFDQQANGWEQTTLGAAEDCLGGGYGRSFISGRQNFHLKVFNTCAVGRQTGMCSYRLMLQHLYISTHLNPNTSPKLCVVESLSCGTRERLKQRAVGTWNRVPG